MSKKITYWQLIGSYRIEVPVIQRDYAQGRNEDRIEALRKGFVADILSSITNDETPLHLGFIYGKIEGKDKYHERLRNRRAIENILNAVEGYAQHLEMKIESRIVSEVDVKSDDSNVPIFIPLDGQQRLTTLFLVHWYASLFHKNNHLEIIKTLSRFTYKTRKSSFEFCRAITDGGIHVDFEEIKNDKLSNFIQKRKWFRSEWLKDSTVKGMLTMLDEIQFQFENLEDKSKLFKDITKDEAPICFDFLDLDELNQTDELYVKMNARGKQLSEFEHFKAWLISHVKVHNIEIQDKEWKSKLDKEWLDFFWKNKGDGYSIDSTIYNFIKQVALFAYIHQPVDGYNFDFTRTVRESEFIPFTKYETFNFFNSETLNFVFNTLNNLCNNSKMTIYKKWLGDIACYPFLSPNDSIFNVFVQNSKQVDRTLSIFYYALILYAYKLDEEVNERHFKTWMRMSRNLVYNTYIQNPENYVDAIRGLFELLPQIKHLNTLPKDQIQINAKSVPFFGEKIFRHEINKISMMDLSSDYEELVVQYENHEYFRGDIRLITSYAFDDVDFSDLNKFKFYGDRLCALFRDNIRNHKDNLLQRALLVKGNYMPRVGSNYLLCLSNAETLRSRRDNWQKAFNDENGKAVIKRLIDNELGSVENLSITLNEIINKYDESKWYRYLIKNPELINFCSRGFIRVTDTIDIDSEPDVYLLRTSKLYGRHAELRSYFQYLKWIKDLSSIAPFDKVHYWENRMNQYEYPCVFFRGWKFKGINYDMDMTYSFDTKYKFLITTQETGDLCAKTMSELNECLGWELDRENTSCFTQNISEIGLEGFLLNILNELNNIK